MTGTPTTRELLHLRIRGALYVAEAMLQATYNDPGIKLPIVDYRGVAQVVAPWSPKLDWDYARQRAAAIHRSCFIGIATGASQNVHALALVRVSRGHMATSLLFLERERQAAVPRGRAMAMMDVILAAVAADFGSTTLVIDSPLDGLVSYYTTFGYATETWRDGRRLLAKPA